MQGAGEQQEAEQAVHQRAVEVDLAEETFDQGAQLHPGDDLLEQDHDERGGERHQERAAGRGEMEDPVVDVA